MTPANPYRAAIGRLRPALWGALLFSAGVNLLMFAGPLFMLQVYDRVLASGSVPTLQGLFAAVLGAYAFLGLYDFLRTRILSRAAYRLDAEAGDAAFALRLRSGLPGGERGARAPQDLATVRGFMASPAATGFFDLPWTPVFVAVTWLIHPWLGMLTLGGAVIAAIMALANQMRTSRRIAKAMSMDGAEARFLEQAARSGEALVPMGMAGAAKDRWRRMHDEGLAIGQEGGDRGEAYTAFSKAFRMLLQSALLGLGGYLALRQEISPGMIVATSIIAGRALAPIDAVIGQWRAVVRAREAHRRLLACMEGAGARPPVTGLPAPTGALAVRELTRRAPGMERRPDLKPILRGVSFDLSPGDGLGVIGPSASGKSTLARLLVGAWKPDLGEVRLDGATLAQWDPEDLGRHIGYLPQTLELLPGTIGENIRRFDAAVDDEAVIAAAKLAGAHEMILKLPGGYETPIGAGAPPLSGGQAQRVGLARALYGAPKLVVLDEPNAHLDAEGDEALTRAVLAVRKSGAAVIVMAHRPSAVAAVNKIMVLNDGAVADFGEKTEVLRRATRAAPAPAQAAAPTPAREIAQ